MTKTVALVGKIGPKYASIEWLTFHDYAHKVGVNLGSDIYVDDALDAMCEEAHETAMRDGDFAGYEYPYA